MKGKQKVLHFFFIIAILSILFGCEDESAIRDENNDEVTGLRFLSVPVTKINVNESYSYVVRAKDNDGNDLIYNAEKIAPWLSFNNSTHVLSGRPTVNHVGYHHVVIRVSNNTSSVTQSFIITVSLNTDGQAWSVYTRFKWIHDGMPYHSEHCIVYSDGASDALKKQIGIMADENFNDIIQIFNFSNISDFRYPPGYEKIEVYINRFHDENIAWAYWGGFIITIRRSDINDPNYYNVMDYTSKHELMHVFEFLIEGTIDLGTDTWFREGIAVHVGDMGIAVINKIDNSGELESWIKQYQDIPGEGNPIKIKKWEDFPQIIRDQNQTGKYYPLFGLAMEYLIDEKGAGKSYDDILNLFYDVRKGIEFTVAFEQIFGFSVKDYETEFYDRMRTFLSTN